MILKNLDLSFGRDAVQQHFISTESEVKIF